MANLDSSRQSPEQTSQWREYAWKILKERHDKMFKERHSGQLFYATSIGEKEENKDQNHSWDILPYNRNGVGVGGRYLNASWVRELHGGRWWIATQTPLNTKNEHTLLSLFLQDVRPPSGLEKPDSLASMKFRISTIVQLTAIEEHLYIPSKQDPVKIIPAPEGSREDNLKLTLEGQKDRSRDRGYIESAVRLVKCDGRNTEPTYFRHFLLTIWEDMSVPEKGKAALLIKFIEDVEEFNRKASVPEGCQPNPPILIHCGVGIGRTGTFIGLSSLLRHHGLLSSSKQGQGSHASLPALAPSPMTPLPSGLASDKVVSEVESLRNQRWGMVQRPEQFELIYELVEYAKASQKRKSDPVRTDKSSQTGSRTGGKSKEPKSVLVSVDESSRSRTGPRAGGKSKKPKSVGIDKSSSRKGGKSKKGLPSKTKK